MNTDLRDRLRRLGVHKGTSNLKPSQVTAAEQFRKANSPLPGHETAPQVAGDPLQPIQTLYGYTFARRADYAHDHVHGGYALAAALRLSPEFVAQCVGRPGVAAMTLRDALFLDTETTGLAGGAGTLAFMVGLGYFDGDGFVVEQFFLRDPAEEMAMLSEIDRRVNSRAHLVTFNGRAFDVPLLETRYTLARLAPSFADRTHLDLLMPARRVWRDRLDSCSLSSLEFHLLGVQRTQLDVPGAIIPYLYREYLAAGAGDLNEDMQRVMYHNLHDILSMVTLTVRLAEAILQPTTPEDYFSAARYHERAHAFDAAERGYRAALSKVHDSEAEKPGTVLKSSLASRDGPASQPTVLQLSTHRRLAHMLKRQRRQAEAAEHWRVLADADDAEGLIEMTKHYEWCERDLDGALAYALRAQRVAVGLAAQQLSAALAARIERLERKRTKPIKTPKTSSTADVIEA